MRTLIVSDLHLGSHIGSDVLRDPELRASLLGAVEEVDRVVLLGDVIELRQGPPREAMSASRPFFEDLGRALGDRELVIVAGNHDHALVEPWLALRGAEEAPPPLGVEQLMAPEEASSAYRRIAGWAAPARVRIAYPGLWVRSDVYATHGHYLDSHLTVPTLERLTVGAMSRVLGHPAASFASVGDYEAVGAPVFAWRDAVARDARTGSALNGMATVGAWTALRGRRRSREGGRGAGAGRREPAGGGARRARALTHELRRRALVAAFPLAVAALNRAGLGPLRAEISTDELRRAGLKAMDEVAVRLGLGDAHVVFGHTHRAGPLPGDDEREWLGRGGARLINTGSWTYSPIFLAGAPGQSPYWPGACVVVEDSGAPVVRRLLQDAAHGQLASSGRLPLTRPRV